MLPGSSYPGVCLSLDVKAALMRGGLGPETFARLSISTPLSAVSSVHQGSTLSNAEDWGVEGWEGVAK